VRIRELNLQLLADKHSGLLPAVDRMFDRFGSLPQVQAMIRCKFKEEVPLASLDSYKRTHWQTFKNMVRRQKADIVAIGQIIGEYGLSFAVNALLWQELQTLTPKELIGFRKVLNDTEKVALLHKQFALAAEKHYQAMKERVEASAGKPVPVDVAEEYDRAQRVVAQVKEMFGIGMTASEPPAPPAESQKALPAADALEI
jgi:hypothetical protein